MSTNNIAGLALFAECDSLFQNLSPADESTISGGRRTRTRTRGKGRGKRTSGRTRTRTGRR